MKNAILLSTALTAMFLASCGGAEKPTDAKAQEELKSIQLQIADLQKKEQELPNPFSTNARTMKTPS